jgi:magnesium-dependent phosphatase 1
MLRLLHIDTDGKKKKAIDFFDHMEIYPGSKITHFTKLQKATGLKYEDMLFFDDEARNRNVESLGVTMYLVRDGVTRDELDNGIAEWRKRRGHNVATSSNSRRV